MKRKFRALLCRLNIHFKPDWSYDYWNGYYVCAYCGKRKVT